MSDPSQMVFQGEAMDLKESVGRKSITSVLDEANAGGRTRRTMPTGFSPLDRVMGGGLRTRNLTLVGGAPGAGKTITTLQWARNLARDGRRCVFACYEHDEATLLGRLLRLELGAMPAKERLSEQGRAARATLNRLDAGDLTLREAVEEAPILGEPETELRSYADRLWLVRASGADTTLEELEGLVDEDTDALFVDYIQKVPLARDGGERERITVVAQGLKELAMSRNVALIAVAAANVEGLEAPRLRLRHLRGSSAIAYEADVVVMLNDKFDIVSRSQMTHDLTNAESFKNQLIFSVEKNRDGDDMIDIEFHKQFDYLRVDPNGSLVKERLIDNRLFTE
jgi:replicative DNA helicase